MTERTINAERVEQLIDVFGSFDENVKKIEQAFGVHITNRNTELKVTAEDEEAVDAGARAIEALLSLAAKGEEIDDQKCAISSTLFARERKSRSRRWPKTSSA